MPPRAIASANISFGLVSIPVKIYPATEAAAEIHFHWLHEKCGTRVKQQYYCPKDDEAVPRSELVKGYEVSKGRYVPFAAEELKALEEQATQAIEITEFVPLHAVDPIYFEKAYHVGPDKGGQKALAMLGKAMAESERTALGRYAARGKQYLVLLRPFEKSVVLQQLHYADELRPPVDDSLRTKVKDSELRLARQLIGQIASDEFKPQAYKDEVRERVKKQIRRKVEGKEITVPAAETRGGKVVDLMEALKASLAADRKPAKRAARKKAARRKRAA